MEESLASIQRTRELDPLSPAFNTYFGSHLVWLKRYDEAASYFRRAVDSTFFMAHWGLGRVHAEQGRYDDAIHELRFIGTDYIGFGRAALLGNVLARAGRRPAAPKDVIALHTYKNCRPDFFGTAVSCKRTRSTSRWS